MCGPSAAENQSLAEQNSLTSSIQSAFNGLFASQSQINSLLTNQLTPIAEAGPDQQGFGPQELAALTTKAGEGVGANYAKASEALNNQLAAQGGGNAYLPTGARAALKGSLATAAANQMSNEELAITNANYTQGRQNWQQATSGLQALSAQMNPAAYSGQAVSANEGGFSMASQINQQKNQEYADIAGGVLGLGMDAASFGAGALGGGGFDFAGGLQALTGKG